MSRKERTITRTINKTTCTMVVFNVTTELPENRTVTLAGDFKTDEDLTKKLKELYETDNEKVVHFKDRETISELYGMTEQTFLDHAELIKKKGDTDSEEPEEGYLDD